MANDRIEQYLEAILEKLNDGTETGVPVPAWRIEQYLAAIYDKCGGGASGGGVLVVHEVETGGDPVLDKNYNEIVAAMETGLVILESKHGESTYSDIVQSAYKVDNVYRVDFVVGSNINQMFHYEGQSATGALSYMSDIQ